MSAAADCTPDLADLIAALPTPEAIADPYPLYARLRPCSPVYGYRDHPPGTVPDADAPVTAWALLNYSQVTAAARDPLQEQSSAPTLMLVSTTTPPNMRACATWSISRSRASACWTSNPGCANSWQSC